VGFVVGLFLGGLAVASALVVVGSLVRVPVPAAARPWVVALAAVPVLAAELGLLRLRLPQNARQVPQFVTGVPFWGPLQFGAEMGTGMRTYSPSGLPHLVALALLLLGSWPTGLAAGVGFATGRALMTLGFLAAPDHQRADAAFLHGLSRYGWMFTALMGAAMTVLLMPS
jgi:hypothetical protein